MTETTEHQSPNESLVQRIIDGDAQAETELVERFSRGVTFILRRESNQQDVVDDLFQETFRLALVKIRAGEIREPAKLPGFMSSLARFTAIDFLRRRRAREPKALDQDLPANPKDSPLQTMLRQEFVEQVRQTIRELKTPRDREILYRFYISEHNKQDICSDLGLNDLHFNRVLHRARGRYKSLLLEKMEKGPP